MSHETDKSPPSLPVEELVKKNLQAVAEIQESAEELGVVHAVLTTELKAAKPSEDARNAVAHTKQVKSKLEATASELESATRALKAQVSEKAPK